ncbi:MAG: hypothetical protein ACRC1W_12505, partial [Shewanella sp.]
RSSGSWHMSENAKSQLDVLRERIAALKSDPAAPVHAIEKSKDADDDDKSDKASVEKSADKEMDDDEYEKTLSEYEKALSPALRTAMEKRGKKMQCVDKSFTVVEQSDLPTAMEFVVDAMREQISALSTSINDRIAAIETQFVNVGNLGNRIDPVEKSLATVLDVFTDMASMTLDIRDEVKAIGNTSASRRSVDTIEVEKSNTTIAPRMEYGNNAFSVLQEYIKNRSAKGNSFIAAGEKLKSLFMQRDPELLKVLPLDVQERMGVKYG